MRLPSKLILIACCVACQALAQPARAQVVQNAALNQLRIVGGGVFGSDEAGLEASMKLEVDAIRRVTGISDSAAKKLEIAAIAAVKNALKKGPDVTLNAERPVNPQQPKPDALSDEDAELNSQKPNPENNNAQRALALAGMRILNASAVRKELIWTKTLSSVLSDEQSSQYEAFLDDRKKRDRALLVQSLVSQMDAYLLLTEQQRTALIDLVDRVQGKELAAQMEQRAEIGGIGAMLVLRAGQQTDALREDALKEILSPAQLAEHKRQKALAAQGPMAAMGMERPQAGKKDQVGFATGWGFNVVNDSDGLKIQSIEEGAAAEKAGLRIGDFVDSISETPVDSIIQLKRALIKIKTPFQIQVRRDGNTIQLEVNQ